MFLPNGAQRLIFKMKYLLREDQVFTIFDSKMAKLHFWPKRGQWDPMWSEFDSIWIKFDPNWVKLGPNEAQSIFTNSRSTAQADVMLIFARALNMLCQVVF